MDHYSTYMQQQRPFCKFRRKRRYGKQRRRIGRIETTIPNFCTKNLAHLTQWYKTTGCEPAHAVSRPRICFAQHNSVCNVSSGRVRLIGIRSGARLFTVGCCCSRSKHAIINACCPPYVIHDLTHLPATGDGQACPQEGCERMLGGQNHTFAQQTSGTINVRQARGYCLDTLDKVKRLPPSDHAAN